MGFVIPVGIKEPFEKLPTGYIVFNIDKISEGGLGKEGDPVYGFLADLTAEEPSEVTGTHAHTTAANTSRITSYKQPRWFVVIVDTHASLHYHEKSVYFSKTNLLC